MSQAKPFTPIEELDFFLLFDEVSDWCWDVVQGWTPLAQRTFGEQMIRAADSVVANLVEGDGRYGAQDAIRFFIFARASARETRLWIRKGIKRKVLSVEDGANQIESIVKAAKLLNLFIKYRRSTAKETRVPYDGGDPLAESL